jgi:hypothetical protein
MKTMMLKPQERSQRKPYMIALRSPSPRLASLHSAKLLNASMICLYCPSHIRKLYSLKLLHFHFVRSPVFNVAVLGYELEYFDKTVSFQMKGAARLANFNFTYAAVASSVRVNLPVTLELRQPKPSQIANGFEIIEAPVPAIEHYTFRSQSALFGRCKHHSKMIILRRAICGLIIETIVTRNVPVTIGPQKSNEVDTAYDFAVFARPVAANEFNLFSVLLIKGRIVQHKYTVSEINLMTRFLPEVFAAGFNAQKQAIDGVVSGRAILVWLHPSCFCAAIDSGGSNQKINVIVFIALWSIHS